MGLVLSLSRIRRIIRDLRHLPIPVYPPFTFNRAELKSVATSYWENHVRPKLPFLARTLGIGREAWVKTQVNEWIDLTSEPGLTIGSHAEVTVE